MSLQPRTQLAHQPLYVALAARRPNPYPTLTKPARYLLDYLQAREVRYPSPMWFGSEVHLAMMANVPHERLVVALKELVDRGLVAVEMEGGAA